MKYGLVIPLWFFLCTLYAQNCDRVKIPPMQYFEYSDEGSHEISTYFVPCSDIKSLSFSSLSLEGTGFADPDPSTPAGIILVLLKNTPDKEVLSIAEFEQYIYKDLNGSAIFFSDATQAIQVTEVLNLGNISNEFVLMPVLVSSMVGSEPTSWFEENCVRLYPEYGLTIIENPSSAYAFTHFDEITFYHWPEDTAIVDFFDFTFTDQQTGQEIPYRMTGNRSFKLELATAKGIFNYEMSWKGLGCKAVEIGVNWTFPTVGIRLDTIAGFRNIKKCVPVRVSNFESVTGFEFTLTWDSVSGAFSEIQNIHPSLQPYLMVERDKSNVGREEIRIKLAPGLDTITLEDSSVLFEWCGVPLVSAGDLVSIDFAKQPNSIYSQFMIYGLDTDSEVVPGGIVVQEDREIVYDLYQLCNTRDGKHRVRLDIVNDDGYPYTYSFHSPLVPDSNVLNAPLFIADVPTGQYKFTIRDSFGFEITETFVVQETIPPPFQLTVDESRIVHPTCLNPFGGQIAVSVVPQNKNYQLNLFNDDAHFDLDSVTGLDAGKYNIEIEDEEGCFDSLSYTLRNPREIKVTWDPGALVLCPGEEMVKILIKDLYPNPDTSLQFQLDGGQVHRIGDSLLMSKPGNYFLQVWNEDGCTLDTTFQVQIGPEHMDVWDTTMIDIILGDTLDYFSTDPVGLTDLHWQYNGAIVGNQKDILITPDESGILSFSATVFDRCTYTDSLMVRVIMPDHGTSEITFPNVFSPNGDGVNDIYNIIPTGEIQSVVEFQIFDRYGNYIYKSNNSNDEPVSSRGWNGRIAGVDAPAGVYVVQVELQFLDGKRERMGFDVLLIR